MTYCNKCCACKCTCLEIHLCTTGTRQTIEQIHKYVDKDNSKEAGERLANYLYENTNLVFYGALRQKIQELDKN